MSSALAISPGAESKWTILNGSMTGAVRLMTLPKFTIGRSPECEFVIVKDPKCSRKHVLVRQSTDGWEIRAVSDKNPLQLNGTEVTRGRLNDGDILTVGVTQIQFNLPSARQAQDGQLAVIPPTVDLPGVRHGGRPAGIPPGVAISVSGGAHGGAAAARQRRTHRPQKNSGPGRLVFYLVLGGILFWLLSPTTKKKPEIDIRTEQQIQADIAAAQQLKEAAEAQSAKKIDRSVTARQAQENYVRGFRDYRKGQYERALVSFQACLALNPDHVLCNRYMRLARRKFDELIQYQIVLGRKYRDQNQYKACRSSFRNVMVMVKDANNPAYQEAKANYEACNSLLQGRF